MVSVTDLYGRNLGFLARGSIRYIENKSIILSGAESRAFSDCSIAPLSLVSTTEELLDRKVAAPV
jgi:hypothetical protein